MNEDNRQENATAQPGAKSGSKRTTWIVAAGAAVLALGGIGIAAATGPGEGMGRHFAKAGFHPGGHFAGRGLDRALASVDATAEQEEKIWAIIDATRADLRPVTREFRDSRETVVALLGAETIDRAAAETLRAERIAAIDEASRKVVAAVLDAAEVLTPEQRTTLVEHFKERGPHRR